MACTCTSKVKEVAGSTSKAKDHVLSEYPIIYINFQLDEILYGLQQVVLNMFVDLEVEIGSKLLYCSHFQKLVLSLQNIKKYGSTSFLRIAQVLEWQPIHKV